MSKNYTQPLCHGCWDQQRPDQPSDRSKNTGPTETCCECGETTTSGIYVRVDPDTVPHPSEARS